MPTRRLLLCGALAACGLPSTAPATAAATAPKTTLAAYRSEAEMVEALVRWRREAEKLRGERLDAGEQRQSRLSAFASPSPPPAWLRQETAATPPPCRSARR